MLFLILFQGAGLDLPSTGQTIFIPVQGVISFDIAKLYSQISKLRWNASILEIADLAAISPAGNAEQ